MTLERLWSERSMHKGVSRILVWFLSLHGWWPHRHLPMIKPTLLQLGTVLMRVTAYQKAQWTLWFLVKVLVHWGSGDSLNCGHGGESLWSWLPLTWCAHTWMGVVPALLGCNFPRAGTLTSWGSPDRILPESLDWEGNAALLHRDRVLGNRQKEVTFSPMLCISRCLGKNWMD